MEHYKNISLLNIEGEIWKDIPNYEGLYQVSNRGRVKSFRKLKSIIKIKVLKIIFNTRYFRIDLCKNNIPKRHTVHRLVSQAFIPNPENKPAVNHKDGNPKNNFVENLEWCTIKENSHHSWYVLNNKHKILGQKGYSPAAEKNKKLCLKISLDGFLVDVFNSRTEASKSIGLNYNAIRYAINKNKVAQGYIWQ